MSINGVIEYNEKTFSDRILFDYYQIFYCCMFTTDHQATTTHLLKIVDIPIGKTRHLYSYIKFTSHQLNRDVTSVFGCRKSCAIGTLVFCDKQMTSVYVINIEMRLFCRFLVIQHN